MVLFIGSFTLVAGLISLRALDGPFYEQNQIVAQPIVSRVPFRAVDEETTRAKKADAFQRQSAVYTPNTRYVEQVRNNLKALLGLGDEKTITSMDQVPPKTRQELALDAEGKALDALRQFNALPTPLPSWEALTANLMIELQGIAALDSTQAGRERDKAQRSPSIIIVHPTWGETERYDNVILGLPDDQEVMRERITSLVKKLKFPEALWPSVTAAVMQNVQPIYTLDAEATRLRKEKAERDEAVVDRPFQANEVIAPAGVALSDTHLKFVREEQRAYRQQISGVMLWLQRASIFGLIALVMTGLWIYVRSYNTRITIKPTRGAALVGLMLACHLLAVWLTMLQPRFVLATTAMPTLLVAIILALAYDQRFAIAAGAVMALLIALSLQLPVGHLLVLLMGVGIAAARLDEVRTRSKLVIVGLWCGAGMAITALLVGVFTRPMTPQFQLEAIRFDVLAALFTGIATGLFVQGILPAIESLFKVTTAMTLKELTDASHPLLRRLAQEAPGTYQHSLRLADIAQEAAQAIGANTLMCKVGALYHDIGKINKPDYFIENQTDGHNRHAKLSPAMSLLIIVGHVKDGLEMAREYRLPSPLRHFIESHHGTTLVEFFYHAARKQSDVTQTPAPTEFEFRYPGPKPQTREAAILMLGDSVEATVRTLDEPTAPRISQLVHDLAQKRLRDGQFNDCNMTLSELHKIEESMIRTVSVMYHGRVKYPSLTKSQHGESGQGNQRQTSAAI